MSAFELYFRQGIFHILDFAGRDHILFIIIMIIIYKKDEWKQILWVISAFTFAHSLTLALSVLNMIKIPSQWIEITIALTIMVTALENIFSFKSIKHRVFLSGVFGLVHGLGFSNFLKSLLGKESDIILPLFAFNLGVEFGQIIIVILLFIILFIIQIIFSFKEKNVVLFISLIVLIQSMVWIYERFHF